MSFLFCRETLLGQLQVYMKTIKEDFNIRISDTGPPTGKNLPEVVHNIVWVRQLEAKVCRIHCSNIHDYQYVCGKDTPEINQVYVNSCTKG